MRRNKGFTLIELMIVVAIIAIIAAIAIPSLLGAKKSANEASAISSLRTVCTVMEQFRNRNGTYAANLPALNAIGLVDATLASGTKSGYTYGDAANSNNGLFAGVTPATWLLFASPQTAGTTGDRWFRINQTGVLMEAAAAAGPYTAIQ
jgi:prepilin-type N-terminal cleavage/methylation domain-containing protein